MPGTSTLPRAVTASAGAPVPAASVLEVAAAALLVGDRFALGRYVVRVVTAPHPSGLVQHLREPEVGLVVADVAGGVAEPFPILLPADAVLDVTR